MFSLCGIMGTKDGGPEFAKRHADAHLSVPSVSRNSEPDPRSKENGDMVLKKGKRDCFDELTS